MITWTSFDDSKPSADDTNILIADPSKMMGIIPSFHVFTTTYRQSIGCITNNSGDYIKPKEGSFWSSVNFPDAKEQNDE